jgi:hypothetical protein
VPLDYGIALAEVARQFGVSTCANYKCKEFPPDVPMRHAVQSGRQPRLVALDIGLDTLLPL